MLWEIEQHDIRPLLYSSEDDIAAIGRDIEVLNVEIRAEVGQLPLGAGLKINKPEILMLNLTAEKHKCWSIG